MTSKGSFKQVAEFTEWFGAQKYNHLVLIPGNHDFAFEEAYGVCETECKLRNITLLHDSGAEIEGIKFWGSGITPWFYDWAFNRERGADIKKHWDLIPEDTEVLVTHGPPFGILDMTLPSYGNGQNVGCEELIAKIWKTQVKLHVFGHIHEGRGTKRELDKLFVNASTLDEKYRMNINEPIRVVRSEDGTYDIE
jgi:Icc-related predicted phosphoesterase